MPAPSIRISVVTARRSTPGTRLQASFGSARGKHRLDHPRDVDAGRAPQRLANRAPSPGRTWAATSAMWIHRRTPSPPGCAETASSKSRAVAGSTVKVARSAQVAPGRTAAAGGRRRLARVVLHLARRSRGARAPPRAAPRRTSRARFGEPSARARRARPRLAARPGPSRPAGPRRDRRARAAAGRPALEQRLDHVEAPAALDHARRTGLRSRAPGSWRASAPSSSRARSSASSGWVRRSSSARTRAGCPCRRARRPSEVKYSPTVRLSAAAVGQRDRLLEGALAVGAGADERRRGRSRTSAAARISEAEAVSPSIRTTTARPGSASADGVVDLLAAGPARGGDDVARPRRRSEAESTASLRSPPPLPRRSRTRPSAPSRLRRSISDFELRVGALAEGRVADVADLAGRRR